MIINQESAMFNTRFLQKKQLREQMKEVLKNLSVDNKRRQSEVVTDYLFTKCQKFIDAKHIALYLAMKHEELDTTLLIETILKNPSQYGDKRLYVPHIEMHKKSENKSPEMCFYELKNWHEYNTKMNANNKFKLRQFNNPEDLTKAEVGLFDLVFVPGLVFDHGADQTLINRLGRGKGYYDTFLSKIPNCYTLGIGFNEQFIPFNEELKRQELSVPMDGSNDKQINEYLCEKMVI